MYLSELKAMDVRHDNWPKRMDHAALTRLFHVADAEINSTKRDHDAFHRLQAEKVEVDAGALRHFVDRVTVIARDNGMLIPPKWPAHVIAYALLRVWIAQAAQERQLRAASV